MLGLLGNFGLVVDDSMVAVMVLMIVENVGAAVDVDVVVVEVVGVFLTVVVEGPTEVEVKGVNVVILVVPDVIARAIDLAVDRAYRPIVETVALANFRDVVDMVVRVPNRSSDRR